MERVFDYGYIKDIVINICKEVIYLRMFKDRENTPIKIVQILTCAVIWFEIEISIFSGFTKKHPNVKKNIIAMISCVSEISLFYEK